MGVPNRELIRLEVERREKERTNMTEKAFYMIFDPEYISPRVGSAENTPGPRKKYETLEEAETAARGVARKNDHDTFILKAIKRISQAKPLEEIPLD